MNRDKKVFIIINPKAGKGNIKTLAKADLIESGYFVEEYLTDGPGDCTKKVRKALKNDFNIIIVVGGDGTINEAVNGFFEDGKLINPAACMAIYPAGTGSDFVRTLMINRKKNENFNLLKLLEKGKKIKIDLANVQFENKAGKKENRLFINVMDGGLGAETAYLVNKQKKRGEGLLTYLKQVLSAVFRYQNSKFRLKIDGKEKFFARANTVVVANGQYFGGGFKIAPGAEIDDGLLEVIVLGNLSTMKILINLYRLFTGSIYYHPEVYHFQAESVEFSADREVRLELDGEDPGFLPAKIEICKKALNVLLFN